MAVVGVLVVIIAIGSLGDKDDKPARSAESTRTAKPPAARTTTRPAPTTPVDPGIDEFNAKLRELGHDPRLFDHNTAVHMCGVLDAGGEEETEHWPARPPAAYLGQSHIGSTNEKVAVAGISVICLQHQAALDAALTGNYTRVYRVKFDDGEYLVGDDIGPGTYTTEARVSDCYWERADAQGNIIDNNFINVAPPITVTVYGSDAGFVSSGCGTWQKTG